MPELILVSQHREADVFAGKSHNIIDVTNNIFVAQYTCCKAEGSVLLVWFKCGLGRCTGEQSGGATNSSGKVEESVGVPTTWSQISMFCVTLRLFDDDIKLS
jgi:hypothetical protein